MDTPTSVVQIDVQFEKSIDAESSVERGVAVMTLVPAAFAASNWRQDDQTRSLLSIIPRSTGRK